MKICKWGNSLAIRLPSTVVEALGLHAGDDVEVCIADMREFNIKKKPGKREFLARLNKYRGRLPGDFHFDRESAHKRR